MAAGLQHQFFQCHNAKYYSPVHALTAPNATRLHKPRASASSSLPNKQLRRITEWNSSSRKCPNDYYTAGTGVLLSHNSGRGRRLPRRLVMAKAAASSTPQPLDLTEENVEKVLEDAKLELAQLFDTSVGITGQVELADLDGPFIKLRLRGKFWHTRSMVLARLSNYLRQRIPEILEVEIEDEKQLDDSPASF